MICCRCWLDTIRGLNSLGRNYKIWVDFSCASLSEGCLFVVGHSAGTGDRKGNETHRLVRGMRSIGALETAAGQTRAEAAAKPATITEVLSIVERIMLSQNYLIPHCQ